MNKKDKVVGYALYTILIVLAFAGTPFILLAS